MLQQDSIIHRQYRIKPIRCEPEDQTSIRIDVAKEHINGDILLLRLTSNKKKVIGFDAQLNKKKPRKNVSGRVLEIIPQMWKYDCTKTETKIV